MILDWESIFIFDSKIVEEDRKNWENMREVASGQDVFE